MKQAILTFEKCSVLLVEAWDGTSYTGCRNDQNGDYYLIFSKGYMDTALKFDQSWEIVGKLSELTKEQAKSIVGTIHIEYAPSPSNDYQGDWDTGYVDYEAMGEFAGYGGDAGYYRSAKESFLSKLRADGYYTKNPAGTYEQACVSLDANCRAYEESQWEIGQLLTYAPEKTWVFTIKQ